MPLFRRCKINILCLQSMSTFSSKCPTDIFHSLLELPLLGYEPKRAVFVRVPLNVNELVLPTPFQKRAELQELKLWHSNKHCTISTSLLSLQKTYSD